MKAFLPSPRRRAREFAVQALYQAQLNANSSNTAIAQQVYDNINKDKAEILNELEQNLEELRERGSSSEELAALQHELQQTAAKFQQTQDAVETLFRTIFFGVRAQQTEYINIVRPLLDRDENSINPIERAVLLMAVYELKETPETPYPVIINEAIEVTKTFGGTDSHKFINGILDKLAVKLRPDDPKRS